MTPAPLSPASTAPRALLVDVRSIPADADRADHLPRLITDQHPTTTGTPHLGNYAGAIHPAIVASRDLNADSFYFLADYHALIKCDDPQRIGNTATWTEGDHIYFLITICNNQRPHIHHTTLAQN